MFKKLKNLFSREEQQASSLEPAEDEPQVAWLEESENPFGVRVLDLRPVTQTVLSTSTDPQCATNAISFG